MTRWTQACERGSWLGVGSWGSIGAAWAPNPTQPQARTTGRAQTREVQRVLEHTAAAGCCKRVTPAPSALPPTGRASYLPRPHNPPPAASGSHSGSDRTAAVPAQGPSLPLSLPPSRGTHTHHGHAPGPERGQPMLQVDLVALQPDRQAHAHSRQTPVSVKPFLALCVAQLCTPTTHPPTQPTNQHANEQINQRTSVAARAPGP